MAENLSGYHLDRSKTSLRPAHHKIWFIFRLVIGLGFIGLILLTIDVGKVKDTFQRVQLLYVLLLLGLVVSAVYVSTLRWHFLLKVQGILIKRWTLFKYYMVMQFFSIILPGFFTSDLVRLYDIRQETHQTAVGMASILMERVTGLLVLSFIGMIASFVTPALSVYPIVRGITVILFIVVLGGMALMLNPFLLKYLARFFSWPRLRGFLERLQSANTLYRQNKRAVIITLLYSAVVQGIGAIAFYIQIVAFDIHVPWTGAIAIAPIITISIMLPLSPGALGLQEGLYILLMKTLGIQAEDALAISFLSRLANIAVGMWGGVYYAFFR